MVQRYRQLRHPERGPEMAALLGHDVDVPFTHLFHELMELVAEKRANVGRALYTVENRGHQGISWVWRQLPEP